MVVDFDPRYDVYTCIELTTPNPMHVHVRLFYRPRISFQSDIVNGILKKTNCIPLSFRTVLEVPRHSVLST